LLTPGNGKTKTGRLWTYVRDDRPAGSEEPAAVWFAYSPDRKGEHPGGPDAEGSKRIGCAMSSLMVMLKAAVHAGNVNMEYNSARLRNALMLSSNRNPEGLTGTFQLLERGK